MSGNLNHPNKMTQEKHSTFLAARIVCLVLIGLGVLICAYSLISSRSETAMVEQSFFYIPMLVGGLMGLPFNRRGIGMTLLVSILMMVAVFFGLITFFEVIWPSL